MLWVYRIIRFGLGSIFIYAGGMKLFSPEVFAVLIEAYGLVPEIFIMPIAVILPVCEVIAGIGLIFDIRGSLLVIAGLLLLFIAVVYYGIWMGLDVDCGCFGPEDPEAKAFHGLRIVLYRDVVMMFTVFFLYGWRRYRRIQPVPVTLIINKKMRKEGRTCM